MIMLLNIEFSKAKLVKILQIDEEKGTVLPRYIRTNSYDDLLQLHNELEQDLTYVDFAVNKYEVEDGGVAYELVHSAESYQLEQPVDLTKELIEDEPSYLGFLRTLIVNGALGLTKDVEEGEIVDSAYTVPCYNIKFNDYFKAYASHLIPSEEEAGKWRWTAHKFLEVTPDNKFIDYSELKFLCPEDIDLGEYENFVIEHAPTVVKFEDGQTLAYRTISMVQSFDEIAQKPFSLINPLVLSRLLLLSETYDMAMQVLTEDLFESNKEISYKRYSSTKAEPATMFVNLTPSVKGNKKLAKVLMTILTTCLMNDDMDSLNQAMRNHPHLRLFASIVTSSYGILTSNETPWDVKYNTYVALKTKQALVGLLLTECKYTALSNPRSFLKTWELGRKFDSRIDGYSVSIWGGRFNG